MHLFDKLDKYKKIKLLDGLQVIYYNKEDVIIHENDHGNHFYIIEEGNVECYKHDEATGGDKFIRNLGSNDYFGELALIKDASKRTLSVKAKDWVKCLVISRTSFIYYLYDFKDELKNYFAV